VCRKKSAWWWMTVRPGFSSTAHCSTTTTRPAPARTAPGPHLACGEEDAQRGIAVDRVPGDVAAVAVGPAESATAAILDLDALRPQPPPRRDAAVGMVEQPVIDGRPAGERLAGPRACSVGLVKIARTRSRTSGADEVHRHLDARTRRAVVSSARACGTAVRTHSPGPSASLPEASGLHPPPRVAQGTTGTDPTVGTCRLPGVPLFIDWKAGPA
jgi:hypothetical protein